MQKKNSPKKSEKKILLIKIQYRYDTFIFSLDISRNIVYSWFLLASIRGAQ